MAARPQRRRAVATAGTMHAVWTAFIGFFIDVYDLYLPVIILAPAYVYFRPAALKPPILDSFIFVTALLGRPAGALFFGCVADTMGRKRTATLTMSGAALCVFVTGLLPGYQRIGVLSPALLIALRFLTGFFAGGQYTGAVTLAMESCPRERRGFYGALIGSSSNVAFVVMAIFGMVLLRWLPSGARDAPYVQWGWRIPFFAGTAIALVFLAYMRTHVRESGRWLHTRRQGSPLRPLFADITVGADLLQGFLLMSGLWLIYFVPAAMMPALLRTDVGLSAFRVTATMLTSSVACFCGFLAGGLIGDRIGRRGAFLSLGLLAAIAGAAAFHRLVHLPAEDFVPIGALAAIVFGVVGLVWGAGPHAYLNERFRTGHRSSAYGIAFSFAIILPSFFTVYQQWLSGFMPATETPAVLLAAGALIVVLAAAWGPETRGLGHLDDEDGATARG